MHDPINAHIITWFLTIILFFSALALHRSRKLRAEKVVHMIMRLFYLLIIGTGVFLLLSVATISFDYILKIIAGLLVISMIELVMVRSSKNKKTAMFWVVFLFSFVLALYFGYKLPLGYDFY